MNKNTVLIGVLTVVFQLSLIAQQKIEIDPKNICHNIQLADISTDILYIPLETNPMSILGSPKIIRIIDSLIFVKNHKPPSLKKFDYSGKFICDIGNQGKGPAEYNQLRSFCIDEKTKSIKIYAKHPDKLLEFSFHGKLKNIYSYDSSQFVNNLEYIADGYYLLMLGNYNGNTQYSYKFYSSKNDLIESKIRPVHFKVNNSFAFMNEFSFYKHKNSLVVKENVLNDTVYAILPDLDIIPRYIFDFGKYSFPVEYRSKISYNIENFSEVIITKNIFESEHYLIIKYAFDNTNYFAFYDKYKKVTCSYKGIGIKNNYDAGLDFNPIYQKNNILVGFIYPFELINHVNTDFFKRYIPRDSGKKKELEQLAKSLDENDNPVLMLVKLKE